MLLLSVLCLLAVARNTAGSVEITRAPFVDPRPTAYYTVTSPVQPSDIVLTQVQTYTAWLSTVTLWSTEPCVSLIEVVPGVTGWILITSYQLTSYPLTRSSQIVYTSTEYPIAWTTLSTTTTTTRSVCSATLIVSSIIAGTTILYTDMTAAQFIAYTRIPGVCTYTTQRPPTSASTAPSLPPGEGTVFTTTQLYTVTYTSYLSYFSIPTITYTQTQCVNPTVTIVTPSTVTVSAWPAGTTTMTSQFHCRVRGSQVPSPQRGIGPLFRSGGPPFPGLWPPLPIPGLFGPPISTSHSTGVPETTQTYTMTERAIVATVTAAAAEKWTAWRTACAESTPGGLE